MRIPRTEAPASRPRGPRSLRASRALSIAAALGAVVATSPALARPTAPPVFCETYPESPACAGRLPECSLCHVSTQPVEWNAYGLDLLDVGDDFEADLPRVLEEAASVDSDEDGVTNGEEIAAGTRPAIADEPVCPAVVPEKAKVPEGYDFDRARRRVGVLYCGRSPSFEEMADFNAGSPDDDTLHERLHQALDACLTSSYFRDEGLHRIADALIRPVFAVGWQSPFGIKLADYDFDYRLFAYALTGDRDARDLLTADYHVVATPSGALEKVEGKVKSTSDTGPQPLEEERRAGMITTQWFFVINTMFSALPRTTAAQAYRSYLGLDLALQQGIWPIPGEPVDVDDKGVQAETCAQCHSTLDPLAYGFAYYDGITGTSGKYNANRPASLIPDWDDPQMALLGKPVADVVEWARVAADSEYFTRNLGNLFFEHAMGRKPGAPDEEGFAAAWGAMPEDGYSARGLIHRLVDLPAFGGVL